MMAVTNWLLEGEPWVVYRTRMDLMGESFDSPGVKFASIDLVQHAKIQALLEELLDWPGQVLKSHKKAGLLLHKLVFIADIGIQPDYPQVALILDKVRAMASRSELPPSRFAPCTLAQPASPTAIRPGATASGSSFVGFRTSPQ